MGSNHTRCSALQFAVTLDPWPVHSVTRFTVELARDVSIIVIILFLHVVHAYIQTHIQNAMQTNSSNQD